MDGQMDIDITKSAADETGVDLIVCLCVATSSFPPENQNTPTLICVQRPGPAFCSADDKRDAVTNLYILNAVRCPYVTYVRNAGRGQLSSE